MRSLGLAALALGVVVIIWEIPFVFSRTALWPVIMVLALAVVALAIGMIRHGG